MLSKVKHFYEIHEKKLEIVFFIGGFLFDAIMLGEVDEPLMLVQQVIYFFLIAFILYNDFLVQMGQDRTPNKEWMRKIWEYRQLALTFFLGTLLNLYSLFFFKSASLFSSIIFVLAMLGVVVANESSLVKKGGVSGKIALFVICIFSFFSLMVPLVWGRVGRIPFLIALACTSLVIYGAFTFLKKRVLEPKALYRNLLGPAGGVLGLFTLFYLIGWIPPVPLAAKRIGIYHNIQKDNGKYIVFHERVWWKFWQNADQEFKAEPSDKLNLFVSIFSPAHIEDYVYIIWQKYDDKRGWQMTDRIPMKVTGGRKEGYRGALSKQNYTPGEWRVSVSTSDGREVARTYFNVTAVEPNPNRTFKSEEY